MLRIVQRKIQKFQSADLTLSFLNDFYADRDRRSDIILVYNGEILKTLMAYENYQR